MYSWKKFTSAYLFWINCMYVYQNLIFWTGSLVHKPLTNRQQVSQISNLFSTPFWHHPILCTLYTTNISSSCSESVLTNIFGGCLGIGTSSNSVGPVMNLKIEKNSWHPNSEFNVLVFLCEWTYWPCAWKNPINQVWTCFIFNSDSLIMQAVSARVSCIVIKRKVVTSPSLTPAWFSSTCALS